MKGLYLEFEALQKKYANDTILGLESDLLDIINPEGFNPIDVLGDVASTAGSPLTTTQELKGDIPQVLPNPINPTTDVLTGISDKISEVLAKMGGPAIQTKPELTAVNNSLTVTTELVKMEPKKVDFSIKDIAALEGIFSKLIPNQTNKDLTTSIATGTLNTVTAPPKSPTSQIPPEEQIDLSVFTKALAQQDLILQSTVSKELEAGGDLTAIFNEKVAGTSTEVITKMYEDGISTAVEEAKKKLNQTEELNPIVSVSTLPQPVTTPLTITKETVPASFNKEIANGLNAMAEANALSIQNSVVNQNTNISSQAPPPVIQSGPTIDLVGPQPKEEPVPDQGGVEMGGTPLLATTMIQMLNLMKSGQLKVKIS